MGGMMDIIVAGGGITGVSTAEWLRRDGHDVTLIDRVAPGDSDQTSYGNAGLLACSAVVPVPVPGVWKKAPKMLLDPDGPLFLRWSYLPRLLPWLIPYLRNGRRDKVEAIAKALIPLVGDTVEQHQSLARGTPAERWINTSEYSYLYPDRAAFRDDAFGFALRKAHGFEWQERDRDTLLDVDPNIGPDYGFAATFGDHGWIADPGRYVADLAAWFEGQGGHLRQAEISEILPLEGGRAAVVADGERIDADRVVIATGAWSARLARALGHEPALESERGYHVWLRGPSIRPPHPYMLADAKCVVTPMEAGLRCAGLAEYGGLEAPASKAPIALFKRRIRKLYPALTWEAEDTWLGHRPSTIDSLPLIGPSPKVPGVIFAFGAQHLGLTMGPKTGRLVADLIGGKKPNIDMTPYNVGRFDN
jgi:D-amino-acid dehydrogenase